MGKQYIAALYNLADSCNYGTLKGDDKRAAGGRHKGQLVIRMPPTGR